MALRTRVAAVLAGFLCLAHVSHQATVMCTQGVDCEDTTPHDSNVQNKTCDIVTPQQCEEVIYAVCHAPFRTAYYHRFVDCLLPLYPLIRYAKQSTADRSCILTTAAMAPFIRMLSVPGLDVIVSDEKGAPEADSKCLHVENGVRKISCPTSCIQQGVESAHGKRWRQRNARAMRSDALAAVGAAHPPCEQFNVLVIDRARRSRKFAHFESITQALANEFGTSAIRTDEGLGDLPSTIRKFASAKVMVHFHGAGGVHALFMPDDAIVVEFSTYRDVKMTEKWRSSRNMMTMLHGSLRWHVHHLNPRQVVNSVDEFRSSNDKEHYLKYVRSVRLGSDDIRWTVHTIRSTRDGFGTCSADESTAS